MFAFFDSGVITYPTMAVVKNKTERISVRVSPVEKRKLKRAARLAGISEAMLIRQVVTYISSKIASQAKDGSPLFPWLTTYTPNSDATKDQP